MLWKQYQENCNDIELPNKAFAAERKQHAPAEKRR